jgi:hypothetical protein
MILRNLNNVFVFLLLILIGCNKHEYKYEIRGKVKNEKGKKNAVWYSDTISFDTDTVFYVNSDKSVVRIYPPFIIKQNY